LGIKHALRARPAHFWSQKSMVVLSTTCTEEEGGALDAAQLRTAKHSVHRSKSN